jgi:chromosome segregation ATPase
VSSPFVYKLAVQEIAQLTAERNALQAVVECLKDNDVSLWEEIKQLRAEVERLRVLHAIDVEENEGLAAQLQDWAKSDAALRALVAELVDALEDFSSGNCGEHLYLDASQKPQEVSQLLARARQVAGKP